MASTEGDIDRDSAPHLSLRDARKKRGLTLSELSEKINFDPSYISLVENGKKHPSERFLIEFARSMELDNRTILEMFKYNPSPVSEAKKIILQFKEFEFFDFKRDIESLSYDKIYDRITHKKCSGVSDRISDLFMSLLREEDQKPQEIISIRASRRPYTDLDVDIKELYAPLCSIRKIPLFLFFKPNAEDYFGDIRFLLDYKLKFSATDFVSVEMLIGRRDADRFPIDLHAVVPLKGMIAFGTHPTEIDNCVEIHGGEMSALSLHAMMVRSFRDRKVLVFRQNRFMDFQEEYVQLESHKEKRYLVQRFLRGFSRVPTDFREGTNWHKHYEELSKNNVKGPIVLDRLMELRLEMYRLTQLRLQQSEMRQICSRSAVEEWASTGIRPNAPGATGVSEERSDRLRRVDNVKHILDVSPNFELAAIDDLEGEDLGWRTKPDERDLAWICEGRTGVVFETTDSVPQRNGWQELQSIIRSEKTAGAFSDYFEQFWGRISQKSRDRREVLNWLSHVRALIERAPG